MKKIFAVCLFTFALSGVALSQKWKMNYGFAIGATNSNYSLANISSGIGRSASQIYNGQLSGWFTLFPTAYVGLETGASVVGLGAKLNQSEFGNRDVVQRTYWLQIPINIVGKLTLRDSSNFILKTGSYIGFGVFGNNYVPDSYTGSARREFSFGKSGTQKSVDFGWSVSLGYKLKYRYLISVCYQQGMRDLSPVQGAYEQRNRACLLSVGYEF